MPSPNLTAAGSTLTQALICAVLILLMSGTNAQSQPPGPEGFSLAPLNKAFVAYRNNHETDAGSLGLIPSPLALETHRPGPMNRAAQLPARYDLRDPDGDGDAADSLLTPVKDQGQADTCWAFATMGALESVRSKDFGSMEDLSEDHLRHLAGFDWGPCGGGNILLSMAYLSRFGGPVMEADDPYDPACDSSHCPDCEPAFLVEDIVTLPARSGPTDLDYLKQAVQDHGGVYAAMHWDEVFLTSDNGFYSPTLEFVNHAVVLVGWDDTRQVPGAPGPGAFIVRNSRGPGFGEGGYFYISYHDPNLATIRPSYFQDRRDDPAGIGQILHYDPLGPVSRAGYPPATRAWGGNWFYPVSDGYLRAVGLFIPWAGMSIRVGVYDSGLGNPFGNLLHSFTVTKPFAGWYTLVLEEPIRFFRNRNLGLAVEYESLDESFVVPLESRVQGYSSGALAGPGQSYISRDGRSWFDLAKSAWCDQCNVNLKAFVEYD